MALGSKTPVIGVSLVLDHPRLTGNQRGYPSSPEARAALARSPVRRLLNTLPGMLRERTLQGRPRGLGDGSARRAARRRPRRGTAPRHLAPRHTARRRARHDHRPASVERHPRAARAAEPDHCSGDRPRPRDAPLARRLPAHRGRDNRAPPRPSAGVRTRAAGAVPRPVPGSTGRRLGGARCGGARRCRARGELAGGLSTGSLSAPATSVSRLGVVPARSRSRRPGARRRLPRCRSSTRARVGPDPQHHGGARDGARSRRRHAPFGGSRSAAIRALIVGHAGG